MLIDASQHGSVNVTRQCADCDWIDPLLEQASHPSMSQQVQTTLEPQLLLQATEPVVDRVGSPWLAVCVPEDRTFRMLLVELLDELDHLRAEPDSADHFPFRHP